jgi:glycosyltransferase involved in cell wall biosynthesis
MNIMLINYEYPPIGAGAATATWHIGQELARRGDAVTVVTGAFRQLRGERRQDGVTVFACPALRRAPDRSNLLEMLSFVISARVHLPAIVASQRTTACIVFFSLPCGPLGLFLKRRYGIPYVVSLRGGDVPGTDRSIEWIHRLLAPVRRAVLKNSRAVVANSDGLRDLSQKHDPAPVSVIPNGVDTEFFHPLTPTTGRSSDVFRILFAGRFQEQKNLPLLLQSIREVRRNTKASLELHMVGDGPQRALLQARAQELGIADVVTWYGWLDKEKLRDVYRSCDCFVNPSRCEGMPNAVLEAMACGLAVIASRVAGNRDVVEDGQTGLLTDTGDESGLRNAIVRLIEDPELRMACALRARQAAVAHHSWESAARDYGALLR